MRYVELEYGIRPKAVVTSARKNVGSMELLTYMCQLRRRYEALRQAARAVKAHVAHAPVDAPSKPKPPPCEVSEESAAFMKGWEPSKALGWADAPKLPKVRRHGVGVKKEWEALQRRWRASFGDTSGMELEDLKA